MIKLNDNVDPRTVESMRFCPPWRPHSGPAITGLLHLMDDVYQFNDASNYGLRVLELGTHCGESTLLIASHSYVDSVDTVDRHRYAPAMHRLAELVRSELVSIHVDEFFDFMAACEDESYDLVYIDGDHDYNSVFRDLRSAERLIPAGGMIAGHDYADNFPGVQRALHDYLEEHESQGPPDKQAWNWVRTYCDNSFLLKKGPVLHDE